MRTILTALYGLALAALLVAAPPARADTVLWPIPSGMCTANQLLYAYDANNAACTSSVPGSTTGSFSTSITVGSGTAITKIAAYTAAVVNFSLAPSVCVIKAYTVTGVTTSDKITVNVTYDALEASLSNFRVAAADTVEITFCNPSTKTVDPEAGTVNVVAIRS